MRKAGVLSILFVVVLLAVAVIAEAQQPAKKIPRIGILFIGSKAQPHLESFHQGLRELSHVEGKNIVVEYRYAEDTMPRGVLGMNASMFKGYLRYIANRRAVQIGLAELFPNEENPFPWMSEMIDLKKERNFFETRVIEYQSGGALSWE